MAHKALYLFRVGSRQWDVHLRSTDKRVAVLYKQTDGSGYRYRLCNSDRNPMRLFTTQDRALDALEKEVLQV